MTGSMAGVRMIRIDASRLHAREPDEYVEIGDSRLMDRFRRVDPGLMKFLDIGPMPPGGGKSIHLWGNTANGNAEISICDVMVRRLMDGMQVRRFASAAASSNKSYMLARNYAHVFIGGLCFMGFIPKYNLMAPAPVSHIAMAEPASFDMPVRMRFAVLSDLKLQFPIPCSGGFPDIDIIMDLIHAA